MTYLATWEVLWIDQSEKLQQAITELEKEEILSIDTETHGWQTGNEQLCLIQIGNPTLEKIYLIDTLELAEWTKLEGIINNPKISLIAHNASFEARQFQRSGIKMRGAIDTLKLAKELRGDLPSRTLKACCKYILDIELSKEEQVSDWSARPLNESQLNYAAVDAEVTYKLYEALHEMEQKLEVPQDIDISGLMAMLYNNRNQYMTLTKDVAAEMELLNLQEEMLKAAIKEALVNGESPYSGEYGSASLQQIKRTEINPAKVRELLPDIADLAIEESVKRFKLKDLMEEHSLEKTLLDEVTEVIGFTERLNLKLGD